MKRYLLVLAITLFSLQAHAFDQTYADWTALLKAHVVVAAHGDASRVDYTELKRKAYKLNAVTNGLGAVTKTQYDHWTQAQREAFLINSYNAFTVKLIIDHYPGIGSIKDIGSWFTSPWKIDFFTLLGHKTHLDAVEAMLRKPGDFDGPRIHFAINCASIGCPMLRAEAYAADQLDAQFDDQARRFLSDHSRNRYADGRLEVSKIFDWYADDFSHGWHGVTSVKQFLAAYAADLTDDPAAQARIRALRRRSLISTTTGASTTSTADVSAAAIHIQRSPDC